MSQNWLLLHFERRHTAKFQDMDGPCSWCVSPVDSIQDWTVWVNAIGKGRGSHDEEGKFDERQRVYIVLRVCEL
jgi:hypothetical protein